MTDLDQAQAEQGLRELWDAETERLRECDAWMRDEQAQREYREWLDSLLHQPDED